MASSETLVIKDINFWPDLAKYLTAYHPEVRPAHGNVRPVHIELNCSVCAHEIGLPDWVKDPKLYTEHRHPGQEVVEAFMVLACGHLIGEACWVKWTQQCREQNKPHSCPLCRFEMRYRCECAATIPARRLRTTTRWPRMEETIPKTQMWRIGASGEPEVVGKPLGNSFEIEWREWRPQDRVQIPSWKAREVVLENLQGGCSKENIELNERLMAAERQLLEVISEFCGKLLCW
ncbi:hypothetical protein KJ359_002854 [Pestalotiopsis sp. 9143b]|nr:hypothetical protein KJ359_002854 [Pestalotiopsis sp. 9143b]